MIYYDHWNAPLRTNNDAAIRDWLTTSHLCPVGGEALAPQDLRINYAIRGVIEEWQQAAKRRAEEEKVAIASFLQIEVNGRLQTIEAITQYILRTPNGQLKDTISRVMNENHMTLNHLRQNIEILRSKIKPSAIRTLENALDSLGKERDFQQLTEKNRRLNEQIRLTRETAAQAIKQSDQAENRANHAEEQSTLSRGEAMALRIEDRKRLEQLEQANLEQARQIKELTMNVNSSNAIIAGAKIAGTVVAGAYLGGFFVASTAVGYVGGAAGGAVIVGIEEVKNKSANQTTWIEAVTKKANQEDKAVIASKKPVIV